eukprot:gene24900-10565_t
MANNTKDPFACLDLYNAKSVKAADALRLCLLSKRVRLYLPGLGQALAPDSDDEKEEQGASRGGGKGGSSWPKRSKPTPDAATRRSRQKQMAKMGAMARACEAPPGGQGPELLLACPTVTPSSQCSTTRTSQGSDNSKSLPLGHSLGFSQGKDRTESLPDPSHASYWELSAPPVDSRMFRSVGGATSPLVLTPAHGGNGGQGAREGGGSASGTVGEKVFKIFKAGPGSKGVKLTKAPPQNRNLQPLRAKTVHLGLTPREFGGGEIKEISSQSQPAAGFKGDSNWPSWLRTQAQVNTATENTMAIPPSMCFGSYSQKGLETLEQGRAEQSRAERSRAKQSRAEQSRVEQSRAEQSRAKQSEAERSRAKQSEAERSRAEQSKAEQSKAEQSRAEQSKAEQSKAGQIKPGQSKAGQSKAGQIKAEQSRADKSRGIRQSKAERSRAKQSEAERSRAKQSEAEQSRAEQSEAEQSSVKLSRAEQSRVEQSKVEAPGRSKSAKPLRSALSAGLILQGAATAAAESSSHAPWSPRTAGRCTFFDRAEDDPCHLPPLRVPKFPLPYTEYSLPVSASPAPAATATGNFDSRQLLSYQPDGLDYLNDFVAGRGSVGGAGSGAATWGSGRGSGGGTGTGTGPGAGNWSSKPGAGVGGETSGASPKGQNAAKVPSTLFARQIHSRSLLQGAAT